MGNCCCIESNDDVVCSETVSVITEELEQPYSLYEEQQSYKSSDYKERIGSFRYNTSK